MAVPNSPLRSLVSIVAIACVASSCSRSLTPAPDASIAPRPERPVVVALEPYLSRLLVARVVAGPDTLRMLFDTGGGTTLITPNVARRWHCALPGRRVDFRMTGEQIAFGLCAGRALQLGAYTIPPRTLGVFDLMALLPPGLPPLDGVLALDAFAGQTITLRLGARELVVESLASAAQRTPAMEPIALRAATGPSGEGKTIFVRVQLNGDELWLEADSGNLDVVLLSRAAAAPLGIDTLKSSSVQTELRLGRMAPERVAVAARPLIHDGALSLAFLSAHELTFDLATVRGWVGRPTTDSPALFPRP